MDNHENLVAEIWYSDKHFIAENNQDGVTPQVTLYSFPVNLSVDKFINSIQLAVDKLME